MGRFSSADIVIQIMAPQIFHLDLFEMLPNLFIRKTRCNYGAEIMALNVGRFAGLGLGHVPKYLNIGQCVRVQERHTGYGTGANACKLSDSAFATCGWMWVLRRGH